MNTTALIDKLLGFAANAPDIAGTALQWTGANAWWIATLLIAVLAARIGVMALLGHRALKHRGAFEVLPTSGFDPGLEDVIQFLGRLSQAQHKVSRWTTGTHRGSAMRIRITSSGGPMSLRLEGADRALAVIRNHGFPQCELRPLTADGAVAERSRPQIEFAPQSPTA